MAPPRRPAAPPPNTTKAAAGWLSRCRRQTRNRSNTKTGAIVVDDPLAILPDDLLFESILSRVLSDAADVARCAAVCRRWGCIVAEREAAIRRALPSPGGPLLPHLALGFFHGGRDDDGRRPRLLASPRFVPTAYASVLLGSPFPGLMLDHPDAGGLFHGARAVASRNGLVVLELRSKARADGVALCVCNPMTGDVARVPPLAGEDFPGHDYACAILTAEDLDVVSPPPAGLLFSLVLVYNRRIVTALRRYTSDSGGWGPEARKPGAQISGRVLRHRHLGPAAVLRGVAYWPMNRAALGVRLDDMAVCEVPLRMLHTLPEFRLLGTTPDGRLSYIVAAYKGGDLSFLVETLDMSTAGGEWDTRQHVPPLTHQLKMAAATELKLRWVGHKSGTVLFTIGKGGSDSGAFAVNLATGSLDKLADGVECNSWKNLCGYEMDRAALFATITARFCS